MLQKNAIEPTTLELLKSFCKEPQLNNFALGGGTNIALRKGHRLSVDLDFFTHSNYDNATIYKTVSTLFPATELLFEQNQTMMFMINGVKVDFILYPFPWLHPFEIIDHTRLITLDDIIPMKLQAISNRFAKKDFWDVDLLLNEISLEKMIAIFKSKFPLIDTGYIIHGLTNFEAADLEDDPVCLISRKWEEIKLNLAEKVKGYTANFL